MLLVRKEILFVTTKILKKFIIEKRKWLGRHFSMAPALCFALWDRASRIRAEAVACMFLYGANKPHSLVYLFCQFCKSDIELKFCQPCATSCRSKFC